MNKVDPFIVAVRLLTDCETLPSDVVDWILSRKLPAALSHRIDILMRKSNEGTLTEAEKQEFRSYDEACQFLVLLQAKAAYEKKKLASPKVVPKRKAIAA